MSKDNTLFYCLGVIGVFLIISLAKAKNSNNKNNVVTKQPEPSKTEPPKTDDTNNSDNPTPSPSVPGNNGTGGLAGTVIKPPTKSLLK